MKPLNGFIISIFLLLLITPLSTRAQQKDCRKMDLKVEATSSQNGKGGTVKVTTGDNDLKFELHLFSAGTRAGEVVRTKIKTGEIENVPAGTYDLVIQSTSKGYCSETRTVTIN